MIILNILAVGVALFYIVIPVSLIAGSVGTLVGKRKRGDV